MPPSSRPPGFPPFRPSSPSPACRTRETSPPEGLGAGLLPLPRTRKRPRQEQLAPPSRLLPAECCPGLVAPKLVEGYRGELHPPATARRGRLILIQDILQAHRGAIRPGDGELYVARNGRIAVIDPVDRQMELRVLGRRWRVCGVECVQFASPSYQYRMSAICPATPASAETNAAVTSS